MPCFAEQLAAERRAGMSQTLHNAWWPTGRDEDSSSLMAEAAAPVAGYHRAGLLAATP